MINLFRLNQTPIFGSLFAKYYNNCLIKRNTMKLSDLDLSPKRQAVKTLKENFGASFNTSKLSLNTCQKMLGKVSGLIKEAKSNKSTAETKKHKFDYDAMRKRNKLMNPEQINILIKEAKSNKSTGSNKNKLIWDFELNQKANFKKKKSPYTVNLK